MHRRWKRPDHDIRHAAGDSDEQACQRIERQQKLRVVGGLSMCVGTVVISVNSLRDHEIAVSRLIKSITWSGHA